MRRLRIFALAALAIALVAIPAAYALKIKATPPPTGFVGVPYSFRFLPEDNQGCTPYEWKFLVGSFPPGLSINKDSGDMTGTPTKEGTFDFFVELKSCAGNTTQRPFTVTILQKLTITTASPLPDGSINQAYSPIQLAATGGTVQSWSIQSGSFPPGITLSTSGVVSGTPTATGVFEAVVFANGGSSSDTKRIRITVTGPLVLGGPDGAPPKSEPVARNYKVGAIVNWGVLATGGIGPYVYSSTPLPAGVTLAADGKVTGTITQAGLTDVTFKVTDVKGATDELQVRFKVKALLAFAAGAPARGKVGTDYSWTIPVTGASKTKTFLASGSFPPGLSLDETTGELTGAPLAPGSYRVKIWVLGDPGTVITKSYTIRISA